MINVFMNCKNSDLIKATAKKKKILIARLFPVNPGPEYFYF